MLGIVEVSEKKLGDARREYKAFLVGRTGSFTANLFHLIASADVFNKKKVARIYPEYVYTYLEHTGELDLIDFEFCD